MRTGNEMSVANQILYLKRVLRSMNGAELGVLGAFEKLLQIPILNRPVECLELTERAYSHLRQESGLTQPMRVGDLDLMRLRSKLGRQAFNEIEALLASMGIPAGEL